MASRRAKLHKGKMSECPICNPGLSEGLDKAFAQVEREGKKARRWYQRTEEEEAAEIIARHQERI